MSYLQQHGMRQTPQSEQMRPDQVENSAGGFVWAVDDWTRLRRFLILGSEGGSYYATEHDLTKENVTVLRKLANEDGARFVNEVVAVSSGGLAPKNDPALFALAVGISSESKETRSLAAEALPQVARIATHLFHFVAYAETMRGWGRTMRWAVSNWYDRNPEQVAFQAVKYRQRDGWSHRDLLRLAHPSNDRLAPVFDWITHGKGGENPEAMIQGFEVAQAATDPQETVHAIQTYGLPREALNPDHLTSPDVWKAMLDQGMPIMALTRNLANMTRYGIFDDPTYKQRVIGALADQEQIQKSRLHPLSILTALSTYTLGHGLRGKNTWAPVPAIVDALDEAFYLAFRNARVTGKRILLALDISGSMNSGLVAGSPLSPRAAACAMAMVAVQTEPNVDVVTFSCDGRADGWKPGTGHRNRFAYGNMYDAIEPYALSKRARLDHVVLETAAMRMGGTDCALPMLYATDKAKAYDAFVIYTDSETWAGNIHPMQALTEYRNRSGIGARLVTVGMVSNGFTIADPNDTGSMDVVGFDSSAPNLISEFILGKL